MRLKPHRYSDHYANQNIAIIGPYPPRLGGISIHIKRVVHKLEQQNNQVTVLDVVRFPTRLQRWWQLMRFLHMSKPQTVFYHTLYNSSIEWLITLLGRFFYGYKVLLVEHSPRYLYDRRTLDCWIFRRTMHAVTEQIFIGTSTYQAYVDNRIPIINPSIESAYLPPDPQEEAALLATYPANLWDFLATHTPLITLNASRMTIWHGKDLYGLDVSLTLLHKLKQHYPRIGLVWGLAERDNQAHFAQLMTYRDAHGLKEHLFILEERTEFWPLIKRSDLLLRPTLSDGWSVSILEAQEFGVPVVASDACTRPTGTIRYATGDQADLYHKVLATLMQSPVKSQQQHKINQHRPQKGEQCAQ